MTAELLRGRSRTGRLARACRGRARLAGRTVGFPAAAAAAASRGNEHDGTRERGDHQSFPEHFHFPLVTGTPDPDYSYYTRFRENVKPALEKAARAVTLINQ